jgi:hypothetical protein
MRFWTGAGMNVYAEVLSLQGLIGKKDPLKSRYEPFESPKRTYGIYLGGVDFL